MSETKLIHAFTDPGFDHPPYINVSRLADGTVKVIVRGEARRAPAPSTYEGAIIDQPYAEIVLSEADWRSLAWSIYAENEDHMREHGRPVPKHGSGP